MAPEPGAHGVQRQVASRALRSRVRALLHVAGADGARRAADRAAVSGHSVAAAGGARLCHRPVLPRCIRRARSKAHRYPAVRRSRQAAVVDAHRRAAPLRRAAFARVRCARAAPRPYQRHHRFAARGVLRRRCDSHDLCVDGSPISLGRRAPGAWRRSHRGVARQRRGPGRSTQAAVLAPQPLSPATVAVVVPSVAGQPAAVRAGARAVRSGGGRWLSVNLLRARAAFARGGPYAAGARGDYLVRNLVRLSARGDRACLRVQGVRLLCGGGAGAVHNRVRAARGASREQRVWRARGYRRARRAGPASRSWSRPRCWNR